MKNAMNQSWVAPINMSLLKLFNYSLLKGNIPPILQRRKDSWKSAKFQFISHVNHSDPMEIYTSLQ